MAGSMNRVTLVGNVGQTPDIRNTQNGQKIASFSIATNETWIDRQSGERKERVEWHRVAVFNEGLVKVIESYVNKGDKILVEGQLRTRKWTDNNEIERYSTEVTLGGRDSNLILLGNGRRDGGSATGSDAGGYEAGADLDSDIPF